MDQWSRIIVLLAPVNHMKCIINLLCFNREKYAPIICLLSLVIRRTAYTSNTRLENVFETTFKELLAGRALLLVYSVM